MYPLNPTPLKRYLRRDGQTILYSTEIYPFHNLVHKIGFRAFQHLAIAVLDSSNSDFSCYISNLAIHTKPKPRERCCLLCVSDAKGMCAQSWVFRKKDGKKDKETNGRPGLTKPKQNYPEGVWEDTDCIPCPSMLSKPQADFQTADNPQNACRAQSNSSNLANAPTRTRFSLNVEILVVSVFPALNLRRLNSLRLLIRRGRVLGGLVLVLH